MQEMQEREWIYTAFGWCYDTPDEVDIWVLQQVLSGAGSR
jgi:hypothetical protein